MLLKAKWKVLVSDEQWKEEAKNKRAIWKKKKKARRKKWGVSKKISCLCIKAGKRKQIELIPFLWGWCEGKALSDR